jgi:hypothetical protein
VGSLRSLRHSPLAKKNQAKIYPRTWRGLLARRLREKFRTGYFLEVGLEVTPVREDNCVIVKWMKGIGSKKEDQLRADITRVTHEFMAGKSRQKPIRIRLLRLDSGMKIREVK